MGSGFSKMKKQARQLEEQLSKVQEEMQNLEVEGQAGNGLVQVKLNGDKELKEIKIHPDCVDKEDIEGLKDLIIAALKDGHQKVQDNSPNSLFESLPFGL